MRLFRLSRLTHIECLAIIQACANLSLQQGFDWTLVPNNEYEDGADFLTLAFEFSRSRATSRTFLLPQSTLDRISTRFSYPPARSSFLVISLWMVSSTLSRRDSSAELTPSQQAERLLWYLRLVCPHVRPRMLNRLSLDVSRLLTDTPRQLIRL